MLSSSIHFVREYLFTLPVLAKFALGMVMLVVIPVVSRRLHIPAAVGLLLSGILVGPYVLDIFGTVRPIADFLAELGKLLLMFFAGLEIDLALFRRARKKSIALGIATTVLPLLFGTAVGLIFGYAAIPAIVIGSLLASHTLLGLPVVSRLGLGASEPVTITVGATVMSDTLSLVVFAICVSIFTTGFSPSGLAGRDHRLYPAGAVRPESPWRLCTVEGQGRGGCLFRRDAEHHEMHQVVVCRHLRTIGSASVLEFWKTQRRQCRSRLRYFGSRSHGETAMHQHLSCALSRLSSSEPDTILRVSGRLPGLHPIHLHRFRTGMRDAPRRCALRISAGEGTDSISAKRTNCGPRYRGTAVFPGGYSVLVPRRRSASICSFVPPPKRAR